MDPEGPAQTHYPAQRTLWSAGPVRVLLGPSTAVDTGALPTYLGLEDLLTGSLALASHHQGSVGCRTCPADRLSCPYLSRTTAGRYPCAGRLVHPGLFLRW